MLRRRTRDVEVRRLSLVSSPTMVTSVSERRAGAEDVMTALVDAGADRRAVNGSNRTPARLLQETRRRG
ncbi:hypothetical protein AB0L86_14105 [Micromonospora musae]|uniref:hypothetical protein n=1 Tax=Micromonospora musae TaxID=1894970 RepID=UPI00343823F3